MSADHVFDGTVRAGDLTPMPTSALLRQAERERDEALWRAADLEQVRADLAQTKAVLDTFAEDNQRLEGENAELVNRSLALKAELASARTELELLRERVAELEGRPS